MSMNMIDQGVNSKFNIDFIDEILKYLPDKQSIT